MAEESGDGAQGFFTALALSPLAFAALGVLGAHLLQAQTLDLAEFLVQTECPDGQIPGTCPGTATRPIDFYDTIHTRYRDWAIGLTGWMTKDSFHWFRWGDHEYYVNIWSWDEAAGVPSDHSNVNTDKRNGGEVIELYRNAEGHMEARFLGTKDVGTPGTNQFFNPCEDHGWVLFDDTIPTDWWNERVYGQRATTGEPGCPEPLNHGFTQSMRTWRNIPYQWPNGWTFFYNQEVLISKQYNNVSIDRADKMEGFVCVKKHGCRIWWKCVKGPGEDLDYRDPKIKSVDCERGWNMADMRASLKPYPEQNFRPATYWWPW